MKLHKYYVEILSYFIPIIHKLVETSLESCTGFSQATNTLSHPTAEPLSKQTNTCYNSKP